MTTIDRYVARTFLSSYAILVLLGAAVYIFSDVVVNLDEYAGESNLTLLGALLKLADYHGYRLPLYFHQLGGVMMAVAAGFTFALMLRSNELAPLVAAGMPLQRLIVPVLFCSLGLVTLWIVNSEVLLPRFAAQIARRYGDLDDMRPAEVRCVRDDRNAILVADELHAREGWLKRVYFVEPDEDRNPAHLIRADAARWDDVRELWVLDRGGRLVMGDIQADEQLGRAMRWEPLDVFAFKLAPDQIVLRQSAQFAELMSISQLNKLLASRGLPNLPAFARARDVRFTQPLVIWVLILLAAPFFLTRRPKHVLAAGGKALLLTGACFGLTFLAQTLPTDADYARLATWLPVLIFGPIGILCLANART